MKSADNLFDKHRSKHLSREERGVIFAERIRSGSQRAISRLLGRPARTIGCDWRGS